MYINDLFHAIDSQDADQFVSCLTQECRFIFGNLPAVTGRPAIRAFVSGFFDSMRSIAHEITDSWEVADAAICHGTVCYTRHDGSTLTVPFANIMRTAQSGICDYRIFVDVSSL